MPNALPARALTFSDSSTPRCASAFAGLTVNGLTQFNRFEQLDMMQLFRAV